MNSLGLGLESASSAGLVSQKHTEKRDKGTLHTHAYTRMHARTDHGHVRTHADAVDFSSRPASPWPRHVRKQTRLAALGRPAHGWRAQDRGI